MQRLVGPLFVHTSCVIQKRFINRSAGIVGMPNVGKSTLFNSLVRKQLAEAANYPFCTIDPNIAKVSAPDDRLHSLASVENSEKVIKYLVLFN